MVGNDLRKLSDPSRGHPSQCGATTIALSMLSAVCPATGIPHDNLKRIAYLDPQEIMGLPFSLGQFHLVAELDDSNSILARIEKVARCCLLLLELENLLLQVRMIIARLHANS
jgi:hypothetical protein